MHFKSWSDSVLSKMVVQKNQGIYLSKINLIYTFVKIGFFQKIKIFKFLVKVLRY